MDPNELKEYRQAMVLALLLRGGKPMTAGAVAEDFITLAQSEGHPRECYARADAGVIAGILKKMVGANLSQRCGTQQNHRQGRPVTLWKPVADYDARAPIPFPPDEQTTPPVKSGARTGTVPPAGIGAPQVPREASEQSPYAGYTRTQLYTLLSVLDEQAGIAARHMREMQEWTDRARRQLLAADFESP